MSNVKMEIGRCTGCGVCVDECPNNVFELDEEKFKIKRIAEENCTDCYLCVESCPSGCLSIKE
ncbi:MAG: 4Fe-4S dicluster domain-containing protein [Candidatus Lokiarchaeota archaeon]|nr:4Fe-4S dicluster domain-containing protein [Candidatus Lokiarchaeota archaeon]